MPGATSASPTDAAVTPEGSDTTMGTRPDGSTSDGPIHRTSARAGASADAVDAFVTAQHATAIETPSRQLLSLRRSEAALRILV